MRSFCEAVRAQWADTSVFYFDTLVVLEDSESFTLNPYKPADIPSTGDYGEATLPGIENYGTTSIDDTFKPANIPGTSSSRMPQLIWNEKA